MNIRDNALSFEGVKVSMVQTKDGVKITFVIHPSDDATDLFSHPVGTRYQVALVQLSDTDEIVPPKGKTEAARAVQAAGMLCKLPEFQGWLFETGRTLDVSEKSASAYIRHYCNVESRNELATNKEARGRFDGLRLQFSTQLSGP